MLNQVVVAHRAEVLDKVLDKVLEYGLNADRPEHMLQEAEEVLATLALTRPEAGFVKRAIAAIRAWLREHIAGFKKLEMTDNEIITRLILPARKHIEGGGPGPQGGQAVPAFAQAKSELQKLAELAHTATNINININKTVDIAKVTPEQAALLSGEGLPVTASFTHTADLSAVRHALNSQGNAKRELARGQVPITDAEIAQIPEIVSKPDTYILGAKSKIGRELIGYVEVLSDGTTLYIEEVRTGKDRLAMTSIRKYPAAKNASESIQTVLLNVRNDGGEVHIVYPHWPSGQAEKAAAMGNNGGFDQTNPDFRFSRTPAAGSTGADPGPRATLAKYTKIATDKLAEVHSLPGKISLRDKTQQAHASRF